MPTSPLTIVHDLLTERGSMGDAELLHAARGRGAHLTADALDDLLHDAEQMPLVVCLPEKRHALGDRLLAGRTFTHRVGAAEIALDVLVADPDLLMLAPLIGEDCDVLAVPDGEIEWGTDVADERYEAIEEAGLDSGEVVALPPGSLAGFRPGTLVGLTLTADGAVLAQAEPEAARAGLSEVVGRLLSGYSAPGGNGDVDEDDIFDGAAARVRGDAPIDLDPMPPVPVPISDVVAALCDADPDVFTAPLAPFGELLEELGFVTFDGEVAAAGFDVDRWRAVKGVAALAAQYGLTPYQAFAVAEISALVHDVTGLVVDSLDGDADALADRILPEVTRDRESVTRLAVPLQDPDTARALLEEALGVERPPAIALGMLADAWEPLAPRESRVALRWLRARSAERLARVDEAEDDLEAARALDPGWAPVLEDLARYAGDRGQAERAMGLLRRAGAAQDDEDLVFLQGLASPARSDLGRNQPCWCGSGRKYKVCHLGKEELSADLHATWLYRKLTAFAGDGPYRPLILDLALRRSRYDTGEDVLVRAFEDPLLMDSVMFEGGAAAEFLVQRGHLLPDVEASMLDRWLEHPRSLFEVEEVRPGRGFRVRDLRTGDRIDLQERSGSRQAKRGMRLLIRPAPVGDVWQIFGGIEAIPMHLEQRALELCDALDEGSCGPGDLVSFLTSRFAPPEMRTPQGDPLVMCTARYRVADEAAVTAELDRRFEADGEGGWSRTVGEGPFPSVLGSLQRDGGELSLSAMSERRFDALRAELEAVGGLELLDVERVPAAEMMRRAGESTVGGGAVPAAGDSLPGSDLEQLPDVQAMLEQFARDYEDKWLDMSIPALGGLTPRQAADDPTRRDDLIRLVDSFDDMPGPGTMQTERVRAALDL